MFGYPIMRDVTTHDERAALVERVERAVYHIEDGNRYDICYSWFDVLATYSRQARFDKGYDTALSERYELMDRPPEWCKERPLLLAGPYGSGNRSNGTYVYSIPLAAYDTYEREEFYLAKRLGTDRVPLAPLFDSDGAYVGTIGYVEAKRCFGELVEYDGLKYALSKPFDELATYSVRFLLGETLTLSRERFEAFYGIAGPGLIKRGFLRYDVVRSGSNVYGELEKSFSSFVYRTFSHDFDKALGRWQHTFSPSSIFDGDECAVYALNKRLLCFVPRSKLHLIEGSFLNGLIEYRNGSCSLRLDGGMLPYYASVELTLDLGAALKEYECQLRSAAIVRIVDSGGGLAGTMLHGDGRCFEDLLLSPYIERVSEWEYRLDFELGANKGLREAFDTFRTSRDVTAFRTAYNRIARYASLGGPSRPKGGSRHNVSRAWHASVRAALLGWDDETVGYVIERMSSSNIASLSMLLAGEFESHPERYDVEGTSELVQVALALAWKHGDSSETDWSALMSRAHVFEFDDGCYEAAMDHDGPLERLPFDVCIVEGVLFWESYGIHYKELEGSADYEVSRKLLAFVVNRCTRRNEGDGRTSYRCDAGSSVTPGLETKVIVDGITRITYDATAAGQGSPRQRGGAAGHRRRGHYRMQAYGPNHSLRKKIWIRPTYVSPSGTKYEFDERRVHLVVLGGTEQ